MTFPVVFNVDANLTGSKGFKLTSTSRLFGYSVASAGDLNGDKIQDIVIGAPNLDAGAAYVVFGTNGTFPCTGHTPCLFDVDSLLNGTNGFKLISMSSLFGVSVASAGDLNVDGIHDIVIGTANTANVAYVVFGTNGTFPCTGNPPCSFDVDVLLNGKNGFKLTSVSSDFGWSVAGAGDLNGDGIHDIVIGTYSGNANAAYVIFGTNGTFPRSFDVDSLLTGKNGFKLTSMSSNFGYSVASAGDLNMDGIYDIIIGANNANSAYIIFGINNTLSYTEMSPGINANAAYVVFGTKGTFPCTGTSPCSFDVDSLLTGKNGFKLTSTSSDFGNSVASVGDLNGDEIHDIVIGTYNNANAAYVVFGSRSAFKTPFDVDVLLNGTNGFKLTSTSSNFGRSVASAGNFNLDGIQDIMVGTYGADAAYIVFGTNSTFPCTGTSPCSFDVDALLNGTNGFKLISTSSNFGNSVASIGYFNVGSIQDLVVGTSFSPGGAAYVVYGKESIVPSSVPSPMLLPSPHTVPTHQPSPAPMPMPIPQPTFAPAPTLMPIPQLMPQPTLAPEHNFPSLQPEPYFAPASPQEHSSSSGNTAMIIGIAAGAVTIGMVVGFIVYAKIKHLWCFADRPEPLIVGEALPIIGDYE